MQVSPSRTIKIGDKEYVLDGSFATLRAVQEAFERDVLHVLFMIPDMRLDQVAKLIHIASGKGTSIDQIGEEIVDKVGAITPEYTHLKTELLAWLNVAIAPKNAREKKRQEMEALLESQRATLGKTTSESPSGSSDGSQASSGGATSGS
jgi:hypothetical protein